MCVPCIVNDTYITSRQNQTTLAKYVICVYVRSMFFREHSFRHIVYWFNCILNIYTFAVSWCDNFCEKLTIISIVSTAFSLTSSVETSIKVGTTLRNCYCTRPTTNTTRERAKRFIPKRLIAPHSETGNWRRFATWNPHSLYIYNFFSRTESSRAKCKHTEAETRLVMTIVIPWRTRWRVARNIQGCMYVWVYSYL